MTSNNRTTKLSSVYIFGNSPNYNKNRPTDPNASIAYLGEGIKHFDSPKCTFWFTRMYSFCKNLASNAEHTFVLSAKETTITKNISYLTNEETKLILPNLTEKNVLFPTLGLYSVLYLMPLFKQIYITGFCTELNGPYANGYFWNPSVKRVNHLHNIMHEKIIIEKLIKQKQVYVF